MFNRSTKLTALLVAAASVASMTPVMAVEKLNQKDGTVKNAVAYDNGKYAYYGYRDKDNNDTGIWYNSGSGQEKQVKELDEYEIKEKYGTKYAYVTEDGNKDEYLVDLSKGTIADDESAEDKENSARGKLISALKKTERYNKLSDDSYNISDKDIATQRLFKNQFGDVWYQYVTTANSAGKFDDNGVATAAAAIYLGDTTRSAVAYTGFFDEKGKYVDVSHFADLKVYSARKNKAVVIEKYGKIYQDEALRVNLKSVKPLAQDKDNIYVLTTVKVDYFINQREDNQEKNIYDFKDPHKYITKDQVYIQKISKAQGDKVDGAYTPKTISSYLVASEDMFDDGDLNDAYKALMGYSDDYKYYNYTYSVVNNDLYVVGLKYDDDEKDEVKVTRISLGKGKYDLNNETFVESKEGLNENNKNRNDIDLSVAKKADGGTMNAEKGKGSVSIDVNGNVWAIDHGKISMFDKSGFKQQYSTDRSYNRLDVYDKNSLIAWEDGEDSYTTVQEGKKQTVDDAQVVDPNLVDKSTITPAKTPGWEKQADGTWLLYDVTGNKVTGWANVGGTWYYMDPATGIMKTGWLNDNGTWYYLEGSGAMKTGWLNDNGTWYYLNGNGSMATGWLNDNGTWYYLNGNGSMATGWLNDNGTWYYLNGNGSMAANTYVDGYWLNGSGAWVK